MVKNKILYIVGGVLLADYLFAQINKPKIYVVEDNKNYNAKVVPPFGIYINKSQADNSKLLQHELVHWNQYKRTGALLFYLKYFIEYALYGYDDMPLEIEARKAVDESEYCIKNYTECVRTGQAKTVSNPNFRKNESLKIEGNINWYISNSKIHGQGIFANKNLYYGDVLDVAAIEVKIPNEESIFRITHFGSKINHSRLPNAELLLNNGKYIVVLCNNVAKGQEITLNYDKNPKHFAKSKATYKQV